ncbi:MAG: LytTR family DNA-binding domain-containing protein [Eubacterium sp.]|nr:LytTR family DNA-binding domain-containing protein [Eubacterium sp.]
MNLRFAYCDDDKSLGDQVKEYVNRLQMQIDAEIEFQYYQDPEELLDAVQEKHLDLVWLDVEMEDTNGLKVARKIRQWREDVLIVFISSYPEYMRDSFQVQPFDFLEKPLEYDTFRNKICHVIRRLKETNQNIVVKDIESGKKICVSLREILYFEKEKGSPYMNIVCNKEMIRTRESLTQFDEYLKDNGFVKINRGCVINMKYVQSFDASEVEIQMVRENKILHISRRNRREVREALAVYKSMGGY